MTPPQLTDDLILRAMLARPHGIQTFVIRNILEVEHGFARFATTAPIRGRLKRLEQAGKVKCTFSGAGCHSEWAITDAGLEAVGT